MSVGVRSLAENLELIVELLHAAATAENLAQGPGRRVAYRTTRHLLGGAVQLGHTNAAIAASLGASSNSIRLRSTVDGLITAEDFAAVAGIPEAHILRWDQAGFIRQEGPDIGGTCGYRASALLAAFLTPPHARHQ
ncbi:hypothetical protein [Leifsonia sp. Le1]|uniref:hypothetical protein n=1 Tax=Leifsonia sp. Le1 TaxID=3404918 RepID=UPI003EBC4AA1